MKRPYLILCLIVSAMWLSNFIASSLVDLGDAEALYYCYSRHLQSSYLDHPPLIGFLIHMTTAVFGHSVIGVRLVPMIMSALCLLFSFLCTKDMFGKEAAAICVLLMFASPVFSIGMTAASPDSPSAALAMLFVWQFYKFLENNPRGFNAIGRPLLSGAALGLAFLAKYTGACLALAALILLFQKEHRHQFKRFGIYIQATIALIFTLPVFVWNVNHNWVGVTHRLVDTQSEAGFSLRNIGALVGGQFLYVGPPVIALFIFSIFSRNSSGTNSATQNAKRLLLVISVTTLSLTYLLVSWSKTAEPHWPALGYLPLFPLAANEIVRGSRHIRRLFRWTVGLGVSVFLIAHIVVLTPFVPAFISPPVYVPKYDLANELRGFPLLANTIRRIDKSGRPVVAAFYTQCAQLFFHLSKKGDPEVRCASPEQDDFDLWYGPFTPKRDGFLFITDNRFDHHVETLFPNATVLSQIDVSVTRGGVEVRLFRIFDLRFSGQMK